MDLEEVLEKARIARANGATRFCMGAAYRSPKPKQLAQIAEMVKGVRALGMETCVTLGMLTPEQARELKDAGLDYYNHNLDTSETSLPQSDHDAHLPGSSRHAAGRARRGHQRVLRRHSRPGRRRAGSRAAAAHARDAAATSGKRADQSAGAGARHAAVRRGEAEAARLRARDRGRAPADAALVRAPVGRPLAR